MQIEFKSRPEAFSLRSFKEWTLRKSTNSRSPLPFGNRNSGYALVPTQRFCNPCREYDSMWQNMPALVGAKGVSTQKISQVISTTVSYCFHAMFPPLFASAQPCSSFHGQKIQRACISDPVMGSNWSAPRSFCQILPSEFPSSASYLKELQLRAGIKIGKKKRTFGPCHVTKLCEFDGFYTACCCRGKGENTGMLDCVAVGSQASVWRLALGSTCWNLETNLSALNHLEQASRKYWSFWFYSTTWSRKSCLHVPVHNNTERRGKGHPASAWRNLMHGGHLWHACFLPRYDHALMTRARRELVREHCAQFTVDVLRAIYQACPFIVCFSML